MLDKGLSFVVDSAANVVDEVDGDVDTTSGTDVFCDGTELGLCMVVRFVLDLVTRLVGELLA